MTTSSSSNKPNAKPEGQSGGAVEMAAPFFKALTPAYGTHAALMGLELFQSNVRSGRALLDIWKSTLRVQQDMMIGLLRQQLGAPAAISAETGQSVRETVLWPFAAAESAFESTMGALMRTEQDAMKYVTEAGRRTR